MGRDHRVRVLRPLLAGCTALALTLEPALGEGMWPHRATPTPPSRTAGRAEVVHALNRLTFGPEPGQADAVARMGLDRWFEQQLRPETIPDTTLDHQLARFPAMQLSQTDLMERFPPRQRLRAVEAGRLPMPQNPELRAVYTDQIAFSRRAEKKKAMAAAAYAPDAAAVSPANEAAGASGKGRLRPASLLGEAGADYTEAAGKKAKQQQAAEDDMGFVRPQAGQAEHDDQAYPEGKTTALLALSPKDRVQAILSLCPEELVEFRRSLSRTELATLSADLSPAQMETLASLGGSNRLVGAEVLESRLLRDIDSQRQVEAVMTDFWLNHFNVYLRKNQDEPFLLPAFERTVREHALGRFEDLLVAVAQSPAMLVYLDNAQSTGPDSPAAERGAALVRAAQNRGGKPPKGANKDRGLNENYARELMELHTLGVSCEVSRDHPAAALPKSCGGGYTQADVTAVAEVFTGWTVDRPAEGQLFHFDERRHEPGSKLVLGHRIGEAGEGEGLEVLRLLASSPATAHRLSEKLAERFVSDTPPPALVDRMTQTYVATHGDIREVLRTMFHSPEFWSPGVREAKVKTPIEFVASAVRATGAEVTEPSSLVQALNRLGMPVFGMQTPNGYSWSAEQWVSTGALVSRMNFALAMTAGRVRGVTLPSAGAAAEDGTAAATEAAMEQELLDRPASARTRAEVLRQMTAAPPPPPADSSGAGGLAQIQQIPPGRISLAEGLLVGSPEFQRR